MEPKNEYGGLNFRRQIHKISNRLIFTFAVPILFIILLNLFTPGQLLFPLFLFLVILCWIASYGWKQAYSQFILFLQRHQGQ